jgi:hypothetical protein
MSQVKLRPNLCTASLKSKPFVGFFLEKAIMTQPQSPRLILPAGREFIKLKMACLSFVPPALYEPPGFGG